MLWLLAIKSPMQNCDYHTEPFGKASAKRQGWINPSVGVVDVIPRGWECNGHLRQSLEHSPHAATDQRICYHHVARSTIGKCFAGANEDTTADI